jgi:DNA replication licensing factor MCM2
LLSFILGQIVKEKARFFQLQRHQQPDLISIKVSELDDRVSLPFFSSWCWFVTRILQAKDHDIYDTAPFLRSKLFAANGYKVVDGVIEKRFRTNDNVL